MCIRLEDYLTKGFLYYCIRVSICKCEYIYFIWFWFEHEI